MIGKACPQPAVEEIVQKLILLAGKTSQSVLEESGIHVQPTLEAAMKLLSAANFFALIVRLLGSASGQV